MSTNPTTGPSRALLDAPADTSIDELPEILATVERWRCTNCGHERYASTGYNGCRDCGSSEFTKYVPAEENP